MVGELGELVIRQPMPSMPVGFWNDPGDERYRAAYFDHFPGVWRHGDWIMFTERGSCVITGRSDATLNRGGVRLGTGEVYSVVEGMDEVMEGLVVHIEDPDGGPGELILFVVLARTPSSTTSCARGSPPSSGERSPAARPRHGRRRAGDSEDPDHEEARAAGEADPARRPAGEGREPRRARRPCRARCLC